MVDFEINGHVEALSADAAAAARLLEEYYHAGKLPDDMFFSLYAPMSDSDLAYMGLAVPREGLPVAVAEALTHLIPSSTMVRAVYDEGVAFLLYEGQYVIYKYSGHLDGADALATFWMYPSQWSLPETVVPNPYARGYARLLADYVEERKRLFEHFFVAFPVDPEVLCSNSTLLHFPRKIERGLNSFMIVLDYVRHHCPRESVAWALAGALRFVDASAWVYMAEEVGRLPSCARGVRFAAAFVRELVMG